MVQLTLPKNSRVTPGKTWPKPMSAACVAEFMYGWIYGDDGNSHTYTLSNDVAYIEPKARVY